MAQIGMGVINTKRKVLIYKYYSQLELIILIDAHYEFPNGYKH
jgi:hypothetical protein